MRTSSEPHHAGGREPALRSRPPLKPVFIPIVQIVKERKTQRTTTRQPTTPHLVPCPRLLLLHEPALTPRASAVRATSISESNGVPQTNPRPQKLLRTTHRPGQRLIKPHRPHHPAFVSHHFFFAVAVPAANGDSLGDRAGFVSQNFFFHFSVAADNSDSLGNRAGFVSQQAPRIVRCPFNPMTYVLGFVSQNRQSAHPSSLISPRCNRLRLLIHPHKSRRLVSITHTRATVLFMIMIFIAMIMIIAKMIMIIVEKPTLRRQQIRVASSPAALRSFLAQFLQLLRIPVHQPAATQIHTAT